jgi:uncharacterized protein YjbI with pentapeptide repeats
MGQEHAAMSNVVPFSSVVRPRASAPNTDGPQLLEDAIDQIADEFTTGVVWLVGGPGSGKSTAINYLASQFAGDARLLFFDEPTIDEVREARSESIVVAATLSPAGMGGIVLRLMPWGFDDLVEYLHAIGREQCNSILERVACAGSRAWTPEVARVLVERFAADPTLTDPGAAFAAEIRLHLPKPRHFAVAADYCLAALTASGPDVASTLKVLDRIRCPQHVTKLLRHASIQLPLAAERLATMIENQKSLRSLLNVLPRELVRQTGLRCRENARAVQRLRSLLVSRSAIGYQPMAVSILRYADSAWRPFTHPPHSYNFANGYFENVDWPGVSLIKSNLRESDFTNANLRNCDLTDANATSAIFVRADLRDSWLAGIRASRANFEFANLSAARLPIAELAHASFANANLTGAILVKSDLASTDLSAANLAEADLCGAKLTGARLDGVNFTNAKLDEAELAHADMRTATLDGACFDGADLSHAQLEDVVVRRVSLRGAKLRYAHLTGSRIPNADLRGATLAFAHLAEIDWPAANLSGADLRGASFHMGSSRSGLVGSPIACEGSKTGFYTDDREEMYFKHPEEVRKANLCGADLRGANVDNVDFYLVDLRGAVLDSGQLAQAQQSGAILDDWQGS